MSTEDQAAACIQARFRGFRWRQKQRRGVSAVSKLQALQRGRFTRREFAELRDFSREQESYQQATRRRQTRIWRNEQELYFLQHTNAVDLERVRAFQQQHSARLIQRSWRAVNNSTASSRGEKEERVAPSDRIYTFDPFGLASAGAKARAVRFSQWRHDNASAGSSQHSLSLLLDKKEIPAITSSSRKLPAAVAGDEAFAARRKRIQERIKRKAAQEKAKRESTPKSRASEISGLAEGGKPVVNRRRELYEQVISMKQAMAQRMLLYERGIRASRPDKEMHAAQLVASCENRIEHLRTESPEEMTSSKEENQQVHHEAKVMAKWDPARRSWAWNHHRRAVCSVLDKRHWWQTQLAGDARDIRQVVVAKSPWEDENKIWVWPHNESTNQKEHESDGKDTDRASSIATWPSKEIQRFLVGDKNMNEMQIQSAGPVGDDEASEWWRAHCTQSHLATNGALLIENPYRAEFSNNVTHEGDVFPVCTSEVVANCDLYKLQQRARSAARSKSLEQDVQQRIKNLAAQVERRVHEMEIQVEANTQLALEIVRRKEEQRVRITREQQSAMTIQRYARGMQGRKFAREVRAEFFVMVRGRAVRRGRCEECGDQRAVLECQQCEESLHVCPICWVRPLPGPEGISHDRDMQPDASTLPVAEVGNFGKITLELVEHNGDLGADTGAGNSESVKAANCAETVASSEDDAAAPADPQAPNVTAAPPSNDTLVSIEIEPQAATATAAAEPNSDESNTTAAEIEIAPGDAHL
ncbi:hypothetical protein PHYPSEUDO_014927 [Phytophthora pseudosyringae]|uniref:Uncharacterized protein n=1 Tax=Phytophthora pseudosyringae TaxID=221518 RepID=A0A8T1W4A4_9STRA|nr:hypothetical protein PHYPSEUDO_014927 [Phytophthora pseudosyringae]